MLAASLASLALVETGSNFLLGACAVGKGTLARRKTERIRSGLSRAALASGHGHIREPHATSNTAAARSPRSVGARGRRFRSTRAPSPRVGVRQEGQTVRLIWGLAADAHGQAEGALTTTLHVKRDTADRPGADRPADRSGAPDPSLIAAAIARAGIGFEATEHGRTCCG